MACGESSGFNLLAAYESSSDSERDSGYTSEEDKKRKSQDEFYINQNKSKKRRLGDDDRMEEDMIVDTPEYDKFQSLSLKEVQPSPSSQYISKNSSSSSSLPGSANKFHCHDNRT